jgi:xanthosine utilization system XapX-like protein
MPKQVARDGAVNSAGWSSLATWWAAALSLAMLTPAFGNGVGALGGGVALIAVIWSLARLRSRAPTARSTSDLVGVVLGDRASTMVALLQLCAYLFLASNFAAGVGLITARLSPRITNPLNDPDGWWWPSWSAVAVLVAAGVVWAVSTWAVAAICAVLAGAAALIGLFLALAVLVRVFSGTAPMPESVQPAPTGTWSVSTRATEPIRASGNPVYPRASGDPVYPPAGGEPRSLPRGRWAREQLAPVEHATLPVLVRVALCRNGFQPESVTPKLDRSSALRVIGNDKRRV